MTLKFRKKYIKYTPYNLAQYKIDNALIYKYGLKNKAEVRKFEGLVQKYRAIAKKYTIENSIYKSVCSKLIKKGIINKQNYNLLNLTVENFLDRRLQTVIALKYNISLLSSRQLIVNRNIRCNNLVSFRPCHLVNLDVNITTVNINLGG
jgi:small subunit ribosomal protein S4